MLDQTSISKTVCGVVPTFAEIFTGARFAPLLYSNKTQGTAYDYKPGELSVIVDYHAKGLGLPDSWGDSQFKTSLCATPSEEFNKPRFSPRIATCGAWRSVRPSCIRIIAWRPAKHFLVLAGDPNHIHDEWWCFVPFGQTFSVEE